MIEVVGVSACTANVASYFDPGTRGSVLTIAPSRGRDGHPAPWPEALCEWIIDGWSKPGDVVLDAFAGSGTTGDVAARMGRVPMLFDLYGDTWSVPTRSDEPQVEGP